MDVAQSLLVRNQASRKLLSHLHRNRRQLYRLIPKRGGFVSSLRCATLDDGLMMWEEYVREAQQHVVALGERAVEVKFEEFLQEPTGSIAELARFCGLSPGSQAIAEVSGTVKRDRGYAYRKDPALEECAQRNRERLAGLGY